jgi:hypothetical protein
MKAWMACLATVVIIGMAHDTAGAFQCPTLIKQAREALDQYRKAPGLAAIKDATIATAETNLRSAQEAHAAGQHDEAVNQAKSTLKLLGK